MADESLPTTTPVKETTNSKSFLPLVAKSTEVILSIFIIGLVVDPLNSFYRRDNAAYKKLDGAAVIYVSVASYMFINVIFIISHLFGDRQPRRTSVLFSSLGCLLHIVAGSVMVHIWRKSMNFYLSIAMNAIHTSKQYNDMLISAAVFTFVNAAVFAFDVFLTMRNSFGEREKSVKKMRGSWEPSSQGRTLIVPPPGMNHNCPVPTNVGCEEVCTVPVAKPIRIMQFLMVTGLFSLTIFAISSNSPYKEVEGILLSVLYGSFLFIELIDIISQFGGDPITDTPMFLFGVAGTLLFLTAAGGIFVVSLRGEVEGIWRLTVSMVLSAISSLLFLLDVLLIFLYGY